MPTSWAAGDLVGRAEQPPHTIRQALNHPQRAAAHRAALPAKLALHSTVNRRTTQYIIQHTPVEAKLPGVSGERPHVKRHLTAHKT